MANYQDDDDERVMAALSVIPLMRQTARDVADEAMFEDGRSVAQILRRLIAKGRAIKWSDQGHTWYFLSEGEARAAVRKFNSRPWVGN